MRVGVIVNGIPRKNPDGLMKKMRTQWSEYDIYYHTWEGQKTPKGLSVITCPEPELTYHPIYDTERENQNFKYQYYRNNRKKVRAKHFDKQHHAFKQIIGYADAYDKIGGDEYDVLIRTRWDLRVSNFDWSEYIERAYEEGPVGTMFRSKRKDSESLPVVETDDENRVQFLPDIMIMHRAEDFDSLYVRHLYETQELWGAEWGWWQVLSEPYGDNHLSLRGGAKVV